MELSAPVFSKIIAQGITEGVFHAGDAADLGEMILRIGNDLNDILVELFIEVREKPENLGIIERKLKLYETAVERILGAPKDSVQVLDKEFLKKFVRKSSYSFSSFWKLMIVTGGGIPPKSLKTEEEIVKYVTEREGAIGYISSKTPHNGVHILHIE